MKTKAANALINWIQKQGQSHDSSADQYARSFARDEKKEDQEMFRRYVKMSEQCDIFFKVACEALHALETMVPQEAVDKENAK